MASSGRERRKSCWPRAILLVSSVSLFFGIGTTCAQQGQQGFSLREIEKRLTAGYPQSIQSVTSGRVTFADGTDMPLDDGKANKTFAEWLSAPDVQDMFLQPYETADTDKRPAENVDPGRARNEAFFLKVYGDCKQRNFERSLEEVIWLPIKARQRLKVTPVNGVAKRLRAISAELDRLPSNFDAYLIPSAGTYNCRAVAGTQSRSAHAYAIAIDIAPKHAQYWRWTRGTAEHTSRYHNMIPLEIVRIFEKHGFIWGGRWYHYDTMHFEYRPELLPPAVGLPQ